MNRIGFTRRWFVATIGDDPRDRLLDSVESIAAVIEELDSE